MADLPVAVAGRFVQCGIHPRVVESGQGDCSAPAHRGFVVQGLEHGREPRRVTYGTEGCHRSFAASGVGVLECQDDQAGHGRPMPALPEEPGGPDGNQWIRIAQGGAEGEGESRARAATPHAR